ncbi:hypothetical protein BCR33DRAFT_775329 [Rhizoclosmatium globosum]|uniref:PH domain-containing protein n=1 Tax=Rhizoclosmatium globosum TaxID=329046 RepID=A0A1Y2AL66_9FUNG|nr:hypothetical protein BCR33DRAFT_775329 [Rhizoclosmatium globosum]|eukprot:ORY23318.1 hypothetical protein BCR33DRAFT_775329 [Rhizoclosmatium globosum]
MSLAQWLSAKKQPTDANSDASSLYSSKQDSRSIYASSRHKQSDWDLYSIPKRAPSDDTRSIKTTITTGTVMGKPHRMQWRSPSSKNSVNLDQPQNTVLVRLDELALDHEEDEDGGDDVVLTHQIGDNSESSSPSSRSPNRPKGPSYPLFDYSKSESLRVPAFSDMKEYENPEPPSSYISKLKSQYSTISHDIESRSQSPCLIPRQELTEYVRPSAFEIAREGWIFYNDHEWIKSFVVATYKPLSKSGILHFYDSNYVMHPYKVLDLTNLTAITSGKESTIAFTSPSSTEPLILYSFTITLSNTQLTIHCATVEDRDCWISALNLMQQRELSSSSSVETLAPQTQPPLPPQELDTLLNQKLTQILDAVLATPPATSPLETAILELQESMEMRTSRIGKMVHALGDLPKKVDAISQAVGGVDGVRNDVESLLGVVTEVAVLIRGSQESLCDVVQKAVKDALERQKGLSTSEIPQSQPEMLTNFINSMNESHVRLETLLTTRNDAPDQISTPSLDITQILETIKSTITSSFHPQTPPQATQQDPPSSKALTNLLLDSLTSLDANLSRHARDTTSRQDLTQLMMERTQESVKQIHQSLSSLEKMDRTRTAAPASPTRHTELDEQRRIDAFVKELERRSVAVLEGVVQDVKETFLGRWKRVEGEVDALSKEKSELEGEVEALQRRKLELEVEVEELERRKRDEVVEPLAGAFKELEKDLGERCRVLMDEMMGLKKARDELRRDLDLKNK